MINLPFNFCFYGNNYNRCLIGSNGVITFDTTTYAPGGYNNWSFSDNLPNGFENALDEGSNNPFNMGHIREGHTEDGQTSEFGVGLKKSIVKLSNKSIIYTRSEKNDIISFLNIIFDIKKMCSKEDPNESYDPDFQFITEDTFYEVHKSFTTGSTIILTNLLHIYRKTEIDELIYSYNIDKELYNQALNNISKSSTSKKQVILGNMEDKLTITYKNLENYEINNREYNNIIRLINELVSESLIVKTHYGFQIRNTNKTKTLYDIIYHSTFPLTNGCKRFYSYRNV
jgi:hypothetical protein